MPISVNPGGIDPQPPIAPATPTQIESQLFIAIDVVGAGTPAQYAVGDVLERVVTYTGSTIDSTVWKNLTTNTDLTVTPPGGDLAQQSTSGLTDAELRASPVNVFVVNPTEAIGLQPGANTTTYSEQFQAISNDTTNVPAQWSEGDIITREAVVDNSTSPATITYTYFNETTGLPINTDPAITPTYVAPTPAELTQIVQQALTDAELRATPVDVYVTNPTNPGPVPTQNETVVTQYEALTTDPSVPSQWTVGDTITYTTTYDYSTEPPTEIITEWFNQTTGEVITDPTLPTAADITLLNGATPPAVTRAVEVHRLTAASETLAAGCTQIDVYVEAGFIYIGTEYFTAGYSFSWTIDNPGETLGAVTIDATNGTALISTAR